MSLGRSLRGQDFGKWLSRPFGQIRWATWLATVWAGSLNGIWLCSFFWKIDSPLPQRMSQSSRFTYVLFSLLWTLALGAEHTHRRIVATPCLCTDAAAAAPALRRVPTKHSHLSSTCPCDPRSTIPRTPAVQSIRSRSVNLAFPPLDPGGVTPRSPSFQTHIAKAPLSLTITTTINPPTPVTQTLQHAHARSHPAPPPRIKRRPINCSSPPAATRPPLAHERPTDWTDRKKGTALISRRRTIRA